MAVLRKLPTERKNLPILGLSQGSVTDDVLVRASCKRTESSPKPISFCIPYLREILAKIYFYSEFS